MMDRGAEKLGKYCHTIALLPGVWGGSKISLTRRHYNLLDNISQQEIGTSSHVSVDVEVLFFSESPPNLLLFLESPIICRTTVMEKIQTVPGCCEPL